VSVTVTRDGVGSTASASFCTSATVKKCDSPPARQLVP
jgi:hypothetical protein